MAAPAEGRINCIALDHSETSDRAFHWYVRNYHHSEDTLVIIHLQQLPQPPLGALTGAMMISEDYRILVHQSIESSRSLIDKYKKLCADQHIKVEVELDDSFGQPGSKIIKIAESKNAEVIITGQRGMGAMGRLFLGSTSDYVLHHSTIPVIVVPPPQEEKAKQQ